MKEHITLEDFISFSKAGVRLGLTLEQIDKVKKSRKILEELVAKGEIVYGVNTGVGALFDKKIDSKKAQTSERNLILSHSAAVGELLSPEESRGMLFLLINMLRKGYSGVSWETLRFLIKSYNNNIVLSIPEKGSLGASGDLACLAHLALSLEPIKLKPGEAISLINGTHLMTSILARLVYQAEILSKVADFSAAMSFCALKGNKQVFDEQLHNLRAHSGQIISAENFRLLLKKEKYTPRFLQDAYSLRCIPQVHGSVKEAIFFVRMKVETEIDSITGNPIILPDKRVVHGCNFHGQPLSMSADFLGIALATLANISERRIERLLNKNLSGLSPFLAKKDSLSNSGLMIAQYTAASLVSENKTLAHPASVDSISVSAEQEDFVSMGAWAVRKARQILQNTECVVAIELLCAMKALEGFDFSRDSEIENVYNIMRHYIPNSKKDRPLADDINAVVDSIRKMY